MHENASLKEECMHENADFFQKFIFSKVDTYNALSTASSMDSYIFVIGSIVFLKFS